MKKSNDEARANMNKEDNVNKSKPKKSIAEDLEKMKNKREDRKKFDEEKKIRNEIKLQNEQNGGKNCDLDFELLIKKKKCSLINQPDNVIAIVILVCLFIELEDLRMC